MMDKCCKTKGMHLCIVRGENFNLVKKNACDLNYWGFHQLHYIAFFRKFKAVREYSSENNLNSSDGFQFESSILPPHSPLFFLPSEELTGLNMLMMYFWDKIFATFYIFLYKQEFSHYYRGGFEPKMTKREAGLVLGIRYKNSSVLM